MFSVRRSSFLQHFLVKDQEPLLFHTGLRRMFPQIREGVEKVMDPAKLRWLSWSHFEADECGAVHEWVAIAPHAEPTCGMLGTLISANDSCGKQCRILAPKDILTTGQYRFATTTLRNCRTGGMRECCLKKPSVRCSALICFTIMHGSSFHGDCRQALPDLSGIM